MNETKNVRVRIAPSPTGYLHLGTARAALYNWLFARKYDGKFILRIEDTDIARSSSEMVDSIIDGLSWLGITWDEGPVFQSKRLELYRKYAEKLLEDGKAYYCYCTPEELAQRREEAHRQKKNWKYDRRCLGLTEEIKKRYEEENRPKALRFLVPEGETTFEDLIHGNIKKNNDEIEDFVIMKSDGTPTYNLAVVIDDYMMGITHTIRGEDHIPNTPKQILLYRALGFTPPKFAHLPLILGKDKSKLSKRHGATSVTQYRNDGFLPEALFNFLALLGWSPGGDREIMTKEEMIESFSLDRISKKAAVFDLEKLEWMNGVYINAMSNDELLERLIPLLLKKGWVDDKTINEKKDYLINFVTLLKTRMRRLTDFIRYGTYFFEDIKNYEEKGIRKYFGKDTSLYLEKLNGVLQRVNDFSKENLENIFRELSETIGIKPAKLIHPVRLAVTGLTVGPGLFDILEVLGKKIVINRLTKAIKYIKIYFNNENGAIV
ncbi:MAG: glutamate--tRNA ligase [Candidatus Cloacimonas sp. 4484_209]|nr:MAG: glutamate--tRNA ligase [Candidatus Cloacimonas sp. 4484_209]